ncbi:ferredoxin [Actinokineospora sp.]|uniref:ferredoxin n=1 Tax=Actinokineospora sp. TaxID=1872133 RepID=UPI004037C43F
MARIEVDSRSCIGAGQCVVSAPQVFDQDDLGIVTVLVAEPAESMMDTVREAALICPSQSISVRD